MRSLSLRGWLVLLVAVVALPLSILAGLAVRRAHDAGQARAEDQLLNRARAMAQLVDREFERVTLGLRILAASTAIPDGDLPALEREIDALSALLDGVPIDFAAADGRRLPGTHRAQGEHPTGSAASAAALGALASGRPGISDLLRSGDSGGLSVLVTVPVFLPPGRDGATTAPGAASHAFAAALPEGALAAALQEGAGVAGPGSVALLTDRSGTVVAGTAGAKDSIGHAVAPDLAARIAREVEGVLHHLATKGGEPASFAFARAPGSGYTVLLSLPEAGFRAPLRAMLTQVALAAVLLLLLGAGFAVVLAARIRRELHRLAQASQPTGSGLPEVDELGRALAIAAAERDRAVAGLAASEHRFRALAEAGALVLWRGDASGAILEGQGWEELTGQPDSALRGNGWLEMVHPEDRPAVASGWTVVLAARQMVDMEYRVRTRSGGWLWVRARGVPVSERPGAPPTEWVGVFENIQGRRLAEQALAEREARLRLAVEAARLSTWEYDLARGEGSRTGMPGEAILAPPPAGFGLEAWLAPMHPEDRGRLEAGFRAMAEGRSDRIAAEFRVRRRPPAEGWAWIASAGAVTERDPLTGAPRRIAGVAQDISERREAEGRRILLAREVDHRAKNVLAVVQSVLRLTRRDRPEEFAAAVERRIGALARAHTLLAEEGWVAADMRALAERELASFPPGRILLEGPAVALASTAVQPLAMVLHELATNAAKYGALSRPEGQVALRWAPRPGTAGLHLTWTESGGPALAGAPARRGFGSRVIETTVQRQLAGRMELRWEATGLRASIHLPAARALAEDDAGASPAPGALPALAEAGAA